MILVTGGAGFLGSVLIGKLSELGESIILCDSFGNNKKWLNVAKHYINEWIAPEKLFSYLISNADKVDTIFHLGAISETTQSNVDLIMSSNYILSKKLANWAKINNKRFLYASSAATYGDGSLGFEDSQDIEFLKNLRPLNPYGWSKKLSDISVVENDSNTQWIGLKFFNVYGPNEYHKGKQKSVVNHFFHEIKANGKINLFKSYDPDIKHGEQARDFIYVYDCIKIMLFFYFNPNISGIFNCGTGVARTFNQLAEIVSKEMHKKTDINYIEIPQNIKKQYQNYTCADINKLRNIGFNEKFHTLEQGIKSYIKIMQNNDIYV